MSSQVMSNKKIIAYGVSDIGLVRQNNEDVWAEIPELGLFLLADGMGGHQAGEVAANEAVHALMQLLKPQIHNALKSAKVADIVGIIRKSIQEVNRAIYLMGRSNEMLKGMGSTLCCLCFFGKVLIYAHVGDSRIYCLQQKKLVQLTDDHSLLQEMIDAGHMQDRQVDGFLYKNILTRAIGTESFVEPTIATTKIQPGDLFLMCSDGLSDLLSRSDIEEILNENPQLNCAVDRLIEVAKRRGGYDNITVVAIKTDENF